MAFIQRSLMALAALACLAAPAAAQGNYPSRPITFIYPYAAGSNADTAWRRINEEVGKILGQPLVHENRVGAGGRVGFDQLQRSKPDGYTIGTINNSVTVFQPLQDPSMALEAGKDFTPLLSVMQIDLVLVARSARGFKSLPDLIAFAKANPGKLVGSSPGPGTGGHIGVVLLNQLAGVDITHAPYQGAAPATQALLSGEADIYLGDFSVKPYVDSGQLVVLGTAGTGPNPVFPNAPIISKEGGLPGYVNVSWNAAIAPPGLPPEIAAKLIAAYNQALQQPALREALTKSGWTVLGGQPDGLVKLIKDDTELNRAAVNSIKK